MVFVFYLLHGVASKYPDVKSISVSVLGFIYVCMYKDIRVCKQGQKRKK